MPDPVKEAVRKWDLAMLASACGPLCEPILERRSVLCDPATPESITESEGRLGVSLPASYRTFVSISNGARADVEPLRPDERREAVSDPTLCLLPVEEVSHLWTRYGDELADWVENYEDEEVVHHEDGQVVGDQRAITESLLISSLTWESTKYFFCLAPVDEAADAGGEGWELWDKGFSEITRFVTFGSFSWRPLRDSWLSPGPVFNSVNHGITPSALDLPADELDSWLDPLQIRRLAAASPSAEVDEFLRSDRVMSPPFTRPAAAQVRALHGDERPAQQAYRPASRAKRW